MKLVASALFAIAVSVAAAATIDTAVTIQSAELDATRPYFIPTHPRVTTTLRFPQAIGAPDGSVALFAEDAAKAGTAEYLVTWQSGDAYLTVTPLRDARMANLNVPFDGRTYVFYFYPVTDPLQAVASLNLAVPAAGSAPGRPALSEPVEITRRTTLPGDPGVALTPARLLGFLDRVKWIHATAAGPRLVSLGRAMNVEIALSREELGASPTEVSGPVAPDGSPEGRVGDFGSGVNDAGLFQIVLLRAVRDSRLNCIGFACLLRNTSDEVLSFDVNSFGARAGAAYLVQRISDAPAVLKPGEQGPAYFIVAPPRNSPLSVTNAWKISVDLVSPRLNPGAALARAFAGGTVPQ